MMIVPSKMQSQMVETQLHSRGIKDNRVLDVMGAVPRHLFVPEALQSQAYNDSPLPIGNGQTISQPYIVAYMTEALQIKPSDKVLEIGTGCGYQTAVLAELADDVYTVEVVESLQQQARNRLLSLGYDRIHFKQGDGRKGWREHAPYDAIIVAAASKEIPTAYAEQLMEGGRIILPVGKTPESQRLLIGVKRNGNLQTVETISVRFVPLVQKEGGHEERKAEQET